MFSLLKLCLSLIRYAIMHKSEVEQSVIFIQLANCPKFNWFIVIYVLCYVCSAGLEWSGLVNAMSGLLCAHLNAVGSKSTYQPLYSFKPQGAVLGK